jgi:inhibitor of cysteine peptidase
MAPKGNRTTAGHRPAARARRAVLTSTITAAALMAGPGVAWASDTAPATSSGRWTAATSPATAPADQVVVHGPDGLPTTPVPVAVGDRLVVQLVENASTGYLWSVTSVSGPLLPTGDTMIPPAQPLPGAPGAHAFTFRVLRPGPGAVTFTLRRPWEAQPLTTATVTVVAHRR